jgi:hypothetical protein
MIMVALPVPATGVGVALHAAVAAAAPTPNLFGLANAALASSDAEKSLQLVEAAAPL